MSYGTSPTRWTVLTANRQTNLQFDLAEDDVLEFTGDGDGSDSSIIQRHRSGTTVDWGKECLYDGTSKVTGILCDSGKRRDTFAVKIVPGVDPANDLHRGDVTKGSGTGGYGTWTAEEGG